MKKSFSIFFLILALCAAGIFGRALPARAATGTSTPPVQQALESVKAYVDDLVTAKDDSASNDTELRIETFKQVLDLSSAEAKDYEYKLLTIDKDDTFEPWKQNALDALTQTLVYYDSERTLVSDPSTIDAAKIKSIAEDFRKWREDTYIPLVTQIQDFILLKQEAAAIQTASIRLQKINENLSSLGYTPDGKNFGALVRNAGKSIGDATDLNRKAAEMFVAQYVVTNATDTASSTSTSTAISTPDFLRNMTAARAVPVVMPVFVSSTVSSAASSTVQDASSTVSSPSAISVKDVIKSSLDNIRGAYQNFIDISNLVRRLLGQ